jgi:hypothetical protein
MPFFAEKSTRLKKLDGNGDTRSWERTRMWMPESAIRSDLSVNSVRETGIMSDQDGG